MKKLSITLLTAVFLVAPMGCDLNAPSGPNTIEALKSPKIRPDGHSPDYPAKKTPAPISSSEIHVEKSPGKNNEYILEPRNSGKESKSFLSVSAFVSEMAKNPVYAETFMRQFASLVERQGLDFYGFRFQAIQGTPCRFRMFASDSISSTKQRPSPLPAHRISMPYPKDNAFKTQYVDTPLRKTNPDAQVRKSPYATSFYRMQQNGMGPPLKTKRLVIPNGEYVTLYNFAKKATAKEITDFFGHILDDVTKFHMGQDFNIFTNAIEGQGVFHFHMHVLPWG